MIEVDVQDIFVKTHIPESAGQDNALFEIIIKFLEEYGFPPTLIEMAFMVDCLKGRELGQTTKGTANQILKRIIQQGLIEIVDEGGKRARTQGRFYIPGLQVVYTREL